MLFGIKSIVLAFSAVSTVFADHQVTIYNYCELPKYRHIESPAFNDVSGLIGVNGGFYNVSIPSLVSSVIIFGESGVSTDLDVPASNATSRTHPINTATSLALMASAFLSLGLGLMDLALGDTAKVAAPALLIAGSPTRTTVHPSGNAILRTLVYYFTCVALRR
ncbi:hypothetical protein FRB95_000926 [Tulasnella sp. JGI-2019a]|nr:hypothetical protein FRB95_000926 [Tulasnella sp. JGI-2019a]